MYQPRPLIALICLLDLMLTMFFASLLMVDPSDAMSTPAPAPSSKPAAAPQADKSDAEKLKALLTERDKTIAGLQAKINAQAVPSSSSTEEIRDLKQQLKAFQYEFADARGLSGKWHGYWECETNRLNVEFELRGYANGKVVQLSARYQSDKFGSSSQVTEPSVEGYLRRDGSLDIVRTYNTLDNAATVWNLHYRMLGMAGTVSGDVFEGYLVGCEVHGKRWFKLVHDVN